MVRGRAAAIAIQCLFLSGHMVDGKLETMPGFSWLFQRRTIPGLFFFIFIIFYLNVQLVDKIWPMLGFELRISGA